MDENEHILLHPEDLTIPRPAASPVAPSGVPDTLSYVTPDINRSTVGSLNQSPVRMAAWPSDSSSGVCSARPSGPEDPAVTASYVKKSAPGLQVGNHVTSAPVHSWTVTRLVEFEALWGATELSLTEVSKYFGCSRRTLHRWRQSIGLKPRRDPLQLGLTARRLQCIREAIAQQVSPRIKGWLAVIQARRAE